MVDVRRIRDVEVANESDGEGAVVEQAEIQVTAASVRIVAILIVFSTSMDG